MDRDPAGRNRCVGETGALAQEASDAIDERIFLARVAASKGDFMADISPKLDALNRKLPILRAVANLGYKRFTEFVGRYDLGVPQELYWCLCNSYSIMGAFGRIPSRADRELPKHFAMQGRQLGCAGQDLPNDPMAWSRCTASTLIGDERPFIDRLLDRVGVIQEKYEKDVCERLDGILSETAAFYDRGKYKDRINRSIFGDEKSTDELLQNIIPREGAAEVAVEATIDKLKNALGFGQDAETGLGVLLTDQDRPSNTGDNAYVTLTKGPSREMTFEATDETGKSVGEQRPLSYEMALAQRIMAANTPLEPYDVFRMAVDVTKGDLPFAMLVAHNLLKEVAYARRLGQPMVIGHALRSEPLKSNVPSEQVIKEQYSRFDRQGRMGGQGFHYPRPRPHQ